MILTHVPMISGKLAWPSNSILVFLTHQNTDQNSNILKYVSTQARLFQETIDNLETNINSD